jgi:rod shape-determining protein MreC
MDRSRDDFVIAIRSAFLKKGNQQRFSLLSLILVSIIFLILGNYNFKIIKLNRNLIKEVIYVSSFIASIPENLTKNSLNKVSDHFKHYDDYQKIKNELQALQIKDLSKNIATFENIELKRLIDDYFVEDSEAYAKVLIDKESPFLRSIVINKGSKNGVKVGMVVYDDIYLIGKIVEVNFVTSRALLISDINSKVPVTIQPINIQAIMSGLDKEKGELQYIRDEKLISKDNDELIVVTSGSGGIFKSGIPIGTIKSTEVSKNNKLIVNFYSDLSQLKYVKILSHTKEKVISDQSNKENLEAINNQILTINSQKENIKMLQQQKSINTEIRFKLEAENTFLKENLIKAQKDLEKAKKNIIKINKDESELRFLYLKSKYGHQCKKSFTKQKLFKVGTPEYKKCVLSKAEKNN